jgi:pyroglutamyl-peptidase
MKTLKTILVTGFEPFDNSTTNPSRDVVLALPDRIGNTGIEKLILPVTFSGSFQLLEKALKTIKPDAVICTGAAARRSTISLERVAVNIADARIPDNKGYKPKDSAINPDGPAAYFSTLPLRKLELTLKNAGVPVEISNTAGTYVCNYIMYCLMDFLASQPPPSIITHTSPISAGFIHIPTKTTIAENWLELVIQAL